MICEIFLVPPSAISPLHMTVVGALLCLCLSCAHSARTILGCPGSEGTAMTGNAPQPLELQRGAQRGFAQLSPIPRKMAATSEALSGQPKGFG